MRASAPTKNQMDYSALSCLKASKRHPAYHIRGCLCRTSRQSQSASSHPNPNSSIAFHRFRCRDDQLAIGSGQQGFIGTWVQFQERSHPYINWNLCWLAQPLTQPTIALQKWIENSYLVFY